MENQIIKYKKALLEKENEIKEIRKDAGELLGKFIQYTNLADREIKKLKTENARLKNQLKKAGK